MRDLDVDLLARLCGTAGVSGREDAVRALVRDEIGGLVDEIVVDLSRDPPPARGRPAGEHRRRSARGRRRRPPIAMSIPSRYAHSASEMCDLGDVAATADLLQAFLEEVSASALAAD